MATCIPFQAPYHSTHSFFQYKNLCIIQEFFNTKHKDHSLKILHYFLCVKLYLLDKSCINYVMYPCEILLSTNFRFIQMKGEMLLLLMLICKERDNISIQLYLLCGVEKNCCSRLKKHCLCFHKINSEVCVQVFVYQLNSNGSTIYVMSQKKVQ